MQAAEKSQVSPYFLNSQYNYADLYVARFFFDKEIRLIMSILPWMMPVKEREIIRFARKHRMRAPHVRKILGFLASLDVVKKDVLYEWHVAMLFDDLYRQYHAIPKKYIQRFYSPITNRTFCDVVCELEDHDTIETREAFRQSIQLKSNPFIAVFKEDLVSQKIRGVSKTTYHKYPTYMASPIIPQHRMMKIYFSILAQLLHTRAILLEALYEEESAFSPYSIFGIFYDDCVSVIRNTPGLLYDNGVVWIVDFCFGAVYNLCHTSLKRLTTKETHYEKTNTICELDLSVDGTDESKQ